MRVNVMAWIKEPRLTAVHVFSDRATLCFGDQISMTYEDYDEARVVAGVFQLAGDFCFGDMRTPDAFSWGQSGEADLRRWIEAGGRDQK